MKTVIYGLSKTGTSALFFKLKRSLGQSTIGLFEPVSLSRLGRMRAGLKSALTGRAAHDMLAKVLPFEPDTPVRLKDFAGFDRQILIVRDPRDRLVSALLYGVYNSRFFDRDDVVHAFLRALRRKEAVPGSVSIKSLVESYWGMNGDPLPLVGWADRYRRDNIRRPIAFHDERPRLFEFRYEDMVDELYGGIEAYLSVELMGPAIVEEQVSRVVRTKGYGAWRDWFTAEDAEYFRPILQPFMDRYYPMADWSLNEASRIEPEHGSLYVERVVNERREMAGVPPLRILQGDPGPS